ncbi:MAG TPA: response regulator transcription factor [Dehalococcoidia bacterium]|nr:response regulator transcription factor [Dehalococcoidia bacterium]
MAGIRVLVADDHPMFRQGVIYTIRDTPGLDLVGETSTAAETVRRTRELSPDVLLLDLQFPDGSGLDVLDAIQPACPGACVIILTAVEDEDALLQALKKGARGYVLKGIAGNDLGSVVRAVAAGDTYVTPQMAGRLLKEMTSRPVKTDVPGVEDLSEREQQILERVAGGLTNKEIGDQLFLSEKTVKHYMTNILEKLHVRNRVEAALLAREQQRKK